MSKPSEKRRRTSKTPAPADKDANLAPTADYVLGSSKPGQSKRISLEPTTTQNKGYIIPPGAIHMVSTGAPSESVNLLGNVRIVPAGAPPDIIGHVKRDKNKQTTQPPNYAKVPTPVATPLPADTIVKETKFVTDLASFDKNRKIIDPVKSLQIEFPKRAKPIVKEIGFKTQVEVHHEEEKTPAPKIEIPVLEKLKPFVDKVSSILSTSNAEEIQALTAGYSAGKPTPSTSASKEAIVPKKIVLSTPLVPKKDEKEKVVTLNGPSVKGEPKHPKLGSNYSTSDIVLQLENTTLAQNIVHKTDLVRTVHQLIVTNPIVIFSKTYCPFSRMAKDIFTRLNQPFRVIELDKRSDGPQIQDILLDMTGARTVPRVFVKGICLGGGLDLRNLFLNGQLQKIIADIEPRMY